MAPIIQADGLTRHYLVRQQRPGLLNGIKALFRPDHVELKALDGISFSIETGSIAGIIGANGAGKSTLLKLLVGIMRRDAGKLIVAGFDPFEERRRYVARIGVVFGQRSNLLWDLSVIESFDLHRAVFNVPVAAYRRRLAEITDIFELGNLLYQPARTLSLGQTMRCAIAQVLLQQPDILFLDEPTIGLDVMTVERLSKTLRVLNHTHGTTIVITSHDLAVIEGLCGQVILLEDGRILFDGSAAEALGKYGRYRRLRFIFASLNDAADAQATLSHQGISTKFEDGELVGVIDAEKGGIATHVGLVDTLARQHGLKEFFIEKPSLKEVVLHAFS